MWAVLAGGCLLTVELWGTPVAQLNAILAKIPDHPQATALLERIEAGRRGEAGP
ncbi:MAG TPA: hypothetical protein VM118_01630 [Acidobacteriota bacterium]|nr:hypothetical protein [Acidobacteriota bacterium]